MTHIVHLSTVHNTLDPRIYFKECLSLSKAGYQVTLLVQGHETPALLPDKIKLSLLGIPKNRLHRISFFQLKALKNALKLKAPVYHFHDPELIFTGLMLKCFGKKVIYDVHEDVPRDIKLKTHIPGFIKYPLSYMASALEAIAGVCFDKIITVTPEIAKRFPTHKTALVKNYPQVLNHRSTLKDYSSRTNDLIYAGSITRVRGFKEMIAAREHASVGRPVRLTLLGSMATELKESFLKSKTSEPAICYKSWVPQPEVTSLIHDSKIGLVILHPTPTFITSLPLKLFEYMAAGIPVIASDFPTWRAIIEKHDCGILVNPTNVNQIAQAINHLNHAMPSDARYLLRRFAPLCM